MQARDHCKLQRSKLDKTTEPDIQMAVKICEAISNGTYLQGGSFSPSRNYSRDSIGTNNVESITG